MDIEQPIFQIGRTYSRQHDLHAKFGGSRQSGISHSATHPVIFIFTGDSGHRYGYNDSFDDSGVFSYTGEGQLGDMTFRAGNKALRDHTKDGRSVLLFTALGKGRPHRFEGEFVVANYDVLRGPDRDGSDRDIIIFHMMRADEQDRLHEIITDDSDDFEPDISLEEARARALAACAAPLGSPGISAVRARYKRNREIKHYVLMREEGRCRACDRPAPFVTSLGTPYLEPHHTTRLSDGGLDHPGHVVALCPNCHTEVHFGKDGKTLNARLIDWLRENESI